MTNNRRVPTLRDMAFEALAKHSLFSVEIPAESTSVYHEQVMSVLVQILIEKRMPKFLHAVADNDTKTVREMLDVNPELLIIEPPKNLVIESKLTWNKFYAEKALTMAVKRKQLKMIELLFPYYDKLEQTDAVNEAKAEALAAWSLYDDEIVIPEQYTLYLQSLIRVFSEEVNFPEAMLSEKTEKALHTLLNILLPKKAVKLDDYIDVELFLYAAYTAYQVNIKQLHNWTQRAAFFIHVIGLIHSVQIPETAEILCEGLYFVTNKNIQKICDRAAALKLLGDRPFYPSSRESGTGLGRDIFCHFAGGCITKIGAIELQDVPGGPSAPPRVPPAVFFWKNYLEQKNEASVTRNKMQLGL